VPVVEIDGRIKRLWSISQKLKRQKIEIEQVYDFIALRIITHSVKDCYAALGIIHQTWSPVPAASRTSSRCRAPTDISRCTPRSSASTACRSRCRSARSRCTAWRKEGIAAHWKYKEGRVGDHRDDRYFQWMRQLLEYQQEVRDPQEFIQSLKVDLYPEEVYTFTPKGLVKAFPRGATPIDFAYSIHTDVGHQCAGARVNGKMVPLRTRLKNGDIVEIITAAGTSRAATG
jgi:GTP pyrophosphokinase